MDKFDELWHLADTLLGPNGCPWDKKQTENTLQVFILEEAYELLEAIDEKDNKKIIEEAGDLLYTVIFLIKIAQIKGNFSINDVLQSIIDKLIRRHPHVFSNENIKDYDEVIKRWCEVKKEEKKNEHYLDSIPKTLPLLSKAQLMIKRAIIENTNLFEKNTCPSLEEEEIANKLLELVIQAEQVGINLEGAFRKQILHLEKKLRDEKIPESDL